MDKKVTTTNITYHYDDITDKMIGKTICETVSTPSELTSSLEVLLMATTGTLLGNVLYRVIRKK